MKLVNTATHVLIVSDGKTTHVMVPGVAQDVPDAVVDQECKEHLESGVLKEHTEVDAKPKAGDAKPKAGKKPAATE